MQEPFETRPVDEDRPDGAGDDAGAPDEIVASPDTSVDPHGLDPALTHSANTEGPLREIAHAFRMNAEALQTLKQMQGDLAKSMKRGDRSELVLQSTRSLNETFRNLTSVQRELLSRLRQKESGGRGPLIPLMLLGLLVVVLAGVYVILDAVKTGPGATAVAGLDPAEIARRERDSWKEGRREGAQHADREIERLQEDLEEAKERRQQIQAELDTKVELLGGLERGKRVAEIERDEFAGQVRKAQNEIVARKELEDAIGRMKLKLDAANKIAAQAEHDLQLQRSRNAYLRERMADYGVGFAEDDPPWRPGVPAGTDPATGKPLVNLAGREPLDPTTSDLLNLKRKGRKSNEALLAEYKARAGLTTPASGSASDSSVPPPALTSGDAAPRAPTTPIRQPVRQPAMQPTRQPVSQPVTQPVRQPVRQPATQPVRPRGAAYGGDAPGAAPPPSLRRTGPRLDREPKSVDRVRSHLNGLLRKPTGGGGAGWSVTRIGGVSADRLGGVIMQRYDATGRMVESIEAKDVRIAVDRERKHVQFVFRDGLRYDRGVRSPLPPRGMPVIMAQGTQTQAWSGSPLRLIQKK